MKDYSDCTTKYGIIESANNFAIVEVRKRSVDDESEITEYKPGTLSLSKSVEWLQSLINEWDERERNPLASGLQQWENERDRRARYKAKRREKLGVK